jgi:hypothetical protein
MIEYRRLGRSGLKVAPLCLGTMQFGWTAWRYCTTAGASGRRRSSCAFFSASRWAKRGSRRGRVDGVGSIVSLSLTIIATLLEVYCKTLRLGSEWLDEAMGRSAPPRPPHSMQHLAARA